MVSSRRSSSVGVDRMQQMSIDVCQQVTRLSAKWLEEGDSAHRQLYCLSVGDDFVDRMAALVLHDQAAGFRYAYNKAKISPDKWIPCIGTCVIEKVDLRVEVFQPLCADLPLVDIMWRPPSCSEDCCVDGAIVEHIDRVTKGLQCDRFLFATGEMGCVDGRLECLGTSCRVYRRK